MAQHKIGIEGLKIYAYHGYYEIEQKIGREFILDISILFNQTSIGVSDDIKETYNYEQVIAICKEEMAITSKMLEFVARRIAQKIRNSSLLISSVTVRISKPQPVLPVYLEKFFVEITV